MAVYEDGQERKAVLPAWDIFLAHSSSDTAIAESLYDLLSRNCRVFLDTKCILPGDEWDTEIPRAHRASRMTAALISKRTGESYYQRDEVAAAIRMSRDDDGPEHRVVPVYIHPASSASHDIPYGLMLKQSLSIRDRRDLPELAGKLLDLLTRPDAGPEPAPPDGPGRTPWVEDGPELVDVVLTINRDYDTFTDEQRGQILKVIGDIIGMGGGVTVVRKERGSVKLTVRMSGRQARELVGVVEAGRLADLGVVGASLQPSVAGTAGPSETFRILSLDGGYAMGGVFTASVLATFERVTGKRLVDHFDMIAGTSAGGIIAIGLGMGASAESILAFFRERWSPVFGTRGGYAWLKNIRSLIRPKYSPELLRRVVADCVGDRPLGESRTRLLIPAYDAALGRIYLFRTPHHPTHLYDQDIPAVDVALATSAEPTFFPAHRIPGRGVFLDGGLGANCPAMVGIVEAVSSCGRTVGDLRVLSVSATNYPFRISKAQQVEGLMGWGPKIIQTLLFSQVQVVVAEASSLLRGRFHRIDYVTEPSLYTMDKTRVVEELTVIGRAQAEMVANVSIVKRQYLNDRPVRPWVETPA
jgi:hypothetical protein